MTKIKKIILWYLIVTSQQGVFEGSWLQAWPLISQSVRLLRDKYFSIKFGDHLTFISGLPKKCCMPQYHSALIKRELTKSTNLVK